MRFPLACLLIVITATLPALAAEPTTAASRPRQPNILILSIEDTSPWLGCYGDKTAPTPNLDRLAREGVRYVNCFATTPVCAPARHTLITGMYATQTGAMHMRNNQPSKETLEQDPTAYDKIPSYEAVPPPQVRCFTEYLRIAGYYATNNAKEDYQFRAPPTAWDESSHQAHYRNRKPGQPFFAVFNSNITHESQTFPNAPKRSNVVLPANVKIPPYYPDTFTVRETLAQTYNNIVAVDAWVGEKLKELDKLGLRDSTIVIFYSDHGVGLPRGKRSCYDSGLRVPLIIRYPDRPTARPRPEVEDRLISFIDFAPTMLSLCGVQPPPYMRGQPFAGEFATQTGAEYVFATADRMDAVMDTVRSVSDGRYRYVRNLMPQVPHIPPLTYRDRIPMMKDLKRLKEEGNATPEQWQIVSTHKPAEEFYDSRTDPHETHNLIESPEHKLRIQDMRDALDRWTRETHDLGLIQPESKMVREQLWPPAGKQPFTAAPMPVMQEGVLTITCETEGASIGYRKIVPGDAAPAGGAGAWKIYTAPVELEPGASYESVAHRIGYRRSPIVQVVVRE
jgi:N-sulfoglucosamine sulfohydrolase